MIKKISANHYIFLTSRFFLGIIFVTSGMAKLMTGIGKTNYLVSILVLPNNIVQLAEVILPCIEIIIGCFFIFGLMVKSVTWLSLIMSLIFIVVNIFNITSGVSDCGCFGALHVSPKISIYIDILLVAMSTMLLFSNINEFSLDSWIRR